MPLNFKPLELQKTDIFIETGTHVGNTIAKIKDDYSEIHTVEIVPECYEAVRKKYTTDPHINFHLDDSPTGLTKILKNVTTPVTFWLDAHVQDMSQPAGTGAPLLEELEVIKNHVVKTHMLLIDDVRLFKKYGTTVEKVKSKILEINKDYTFEFGRGYIANDVLIARVGGAKTKENNTTMLSEALRILKDTGHPTRSVVHVGMHNATEVDAYKRAGFSDIVYIEADEALCVAQAGRKDIEVINAVVSDVEGEVSFYKASNRGVSSSILKPTAHLDNFRNVKFDAPVKLRAETLDQALQRSGNYNADTIDLLVLDIQGAELLALKSFSDLHKVAVVKVDVHTKSFYKGATTINSLLNFFTKNNFRMVKYSRSKYGSAIFVNSARRQVRDYTFAVPVNEPYYAGSHGGLMDQILAMFENRLYAETALNTRVAFRVTVNDHCPGSLLDFFEPIPRVTYFNDEAPYSEPFAHNRSPRWLSRYPNASIIARTQDLKVKPKIEQHVIDILNNNPNLLAVHVRKTDRGWRHRLSLNTKEVYRRCDEHTGPIYLATCSPAIQRSMAERYGGRLVSFGPVENKGGRRCTSLEHAVVDLAVCLEAPESLPDPCSGWCYFTRAFREAGNSLLKTSKSLALKKEVKIISFYSEPEEFSTYYTKHSQRFVENCRQLGLDCFVEHLEGHGDYCKNTLLKPKFIKECLLKFKTPVLWLDVDSTLETRPDFNSFRDSDFAAVRQRSKLGLHAYCLYFNDTAKSHEILDRWIAKCAACEDPLTADHQHLAWSVEKKDIHFMKTAPKLVFSPKSEIVSKKWT